MIGRAMLSQVSVPLNGIRSAMMIIAPKPIRTAWNRAPAAHRAHRLP
jgi:hypothetical protein